MAVRSEQREPTMAEPTMAEQRQPVVELAADAWVPVRRPLRAALVVEVVQAVDPCRMLGLDRASTSRRPLTSTWAAAVTSPTCDPAGILLA
jgi:hypothetical protein